MLVGVVDAQEFRSQILQAVRQVHDAKEGHKNVNTESIAKSSAQETAENAAIRDTMAKTNDLLADIKDVLISIKEDPKTSQI